MGRMPVRPRVAAFAARGCPPTAAWRIARRFHRLSPRGGWVAYALRTRPPLSSPKKGTPVRLACIRPAASVHPEPGSNSSLYYCLSYPVPYPGSAFASSTPSASAPRAASLSPPKDHLGPMGCLVLASDCQRTSQTSTLSSSPLRLRVQKYYLFP